MLQSFFLGMFQELLETDGKIRTALLVSAKIRARLMFLSWRDMRLVPRLKALPRPLLVVLIGAGLPLALLWSLAVSKLDGGLFAALRASLNDLINHRSGPRPLEWKDALQNLLILVGLPTAFLIWAFRDYHVNATLENQRKDVNLKEFQDIQMRAAGALDADFPVEARTQLQVAALHQLRGFLRGEYGPSFRRPAFELLLAGHTATIERLGLRAAVAEKSPEGTVAVLSEIDLFRKKLDVVDRERMGIIRDEWRSIFRSGFPLNGRCFDLITLPNDAVLADLDLSGSSFIGATANQPYLQRCVLNGTQFVGARFLKADLRFARVREAKFDHGEFTDSTFAFTVILRTIFVETGLRNISMLGVNFFESKFDDCDLWIVNGRLSEGLPSEMYLGHTRMRID